MFFHLRVVEAKDLPKKDIFGKIDPYVYIAPSSGKGIVCTKVKPKTYEPFWNENFVFPVLDFNLDYIKLVIKDSDSGQQDEAVSKIELYFRDFQINKVYDVWYEPKPMGRCKSGGKLHLVIHLAEKGLKPFVDAPPPAVIPLPEPVPTPQPVMMQPGMMCQPGMMQPNMMCQPGMMQPNMMCQPGMMQPNMMCQPGMMQPNMMNQPGMIQPNMMNQPGMMQPNMMCQPGMMQPNMMCQPGMMQPNMMYQPGMMQPK